MNWATGSALNSVHSANPLSELVFRRQQSTAYFGFVEEMLHIGWPVGESLQIGWFGQAEQAVGEGSDLLRLQVLEMLVAVGSKDLGFEG